MRGKAQRRPSPRPAALRRHWNHESTLKKRCSPSQRRILAGAAPIRGVKSRLLEVPQFPDARSKSSACDGAGLATQCFAVFRSFISPAVGVACSDSDCDDEDDDDDG